MWYVYRGVNRTLKEIYFGVSKDPLGRVDGSHCRGSTKALRDWDCEEHAIHWSVVGEFERQSDASESAHRRERRVPPARYARYIIIQTAGI